MEETIPVEADLSLMSLREALEQLGALKATLFVTREEVDLGMDLAEEISMVGGPYVMVDYSRPLSNRDSWYVENGTHKVWGSKGT